MILNNDRKIGEMKQNSILGFLISSHVTDNKTLHNMKESGWGLLTRQVDTS